MKRKNHIISIENPCSQDWAKMTPHEAGRYCNECSRHLTDFSVLSDHEIIKILEQSNGGACGRFSRSQLDRPLIPEVSQQNYAYLYKVLTGVMLLSTAAGISSFAQQAKIPANPPLKTEHSGKTADGVDKNIPLSTKSPIIIEGRILEEDSEEPISKANITIKNTTIETVTDSNGYFKIIIPDSLVDRKIRLEIESDYYDLKELKIKTNKSKVLKDIFLHPERLIMGKIKTRRFEF